MKTNHLFNIYRLIQAAALSASLIFTSSAFATYSSYLVDLNSRKVTDFGSLGGGQATAINDAGQVAGYFRTTVGSTHAFLTGPNGIGMADLGTLGGSSSGAYGINASGQVVGYAQTNTGDYHAFITGPNGMGMTDLGSLGGGSYSDAYGINASGQVAGTSFIIPNDGYNYHAFITGPQRGRHD